MRILAEQTLVECLDLIEAGESAATILTRHPESVDVLRPFLATAVCLSELASHPTPAAMQRSQCQLLKHAAELRTAAAPASVWRRWWQRLIVVASTVLVFLVAGIPPATA